MAKDLLLEIGTEEIPARFMAGILEQLDNIARTKLNELRIKYSDIKAYGTPRRLVLVIKELAEIQEDKYSENKGPSVKIAFDENGQPTKAAQGFARGQGVDVGSLIVKEGYVYAVVHEVGRAARELMPEVLPQIINSLTFPKNMRWGNLDMRFVRPIKWLLALLGNETVPFTVAEVSTGNITRGHRFLSSGDIVINSVDEYFSKLAANYVIVNQEERRQLIRRQIEDIAAYHGGKVVVDEDLLEEVVHLVEYPTALCGKFDEKYLNLPPQVIITPMREHQRYFPVVDQSGQLLPMFITVRNGGADYIDIVRQGNERVLKARLADAQFFFEEDKKVPLAQRVDKLKTIVFQEGLGTLYDKTVRIERLAADIAKDLAIAGDMLNLISRAARLAKADLVTNMVYEFTELQGVMGREYALINGEDRLVADAIYEHYLPRFAGDVLPQGEIGRIISIADKLDNIVATFSRGLIPTGSQDPYALRRQAQGIVNTIIDAKYSLSISKLIDCSMDLLGIADNDKRKQLSAGVSEFVCLRIKNLLSEEGLRYDMIDAVIAAGIDDVYDVWLRAKAMSLEGGTIAMQRAVRAFTRVSNLAKNAVSDNIDSSLFVHQAERDLYGAVSDAKRAISDMIAQKNYSGVLTTMSALADPIDAFFGAVMVMDKDENIKNNRLALLKSIIGLTDKVADLSRINAI